MARLALDTGVLIAFLDAADEQHARAIELLRPRLAAGDRILLGASVYAEVMVRPLQQAVDATVERFLDAIGATVVPLDRLLARRAAGLRARHRRLRLPDAFSLATALAADADLLTLDPRLAQIADHERTHRP